jgi:DNA-binding GntR family transcriptional regulator
MVGANRVAVTRALGRLQEEGAVELRQRTILRVLPSTR